MARIQVLDLPDEETPDGNMVTRFALILDQYDIDTSGPPFGIDQFAEQCGARSILVSAHTIDIDTPAVAQIGTVSVKVEPDVSGFEEAITAAVERAQTALVDALSTGRVGNVGVYVGDMPVTNARSQEAMRRADEFVADKP